MATDDARKERWLRELRINGFVILPRLLDPDWVAAVHEQLVPILNGEFERHARGEARTHRAASRLAIDVARYADLLGGPLAERAYRRHPLIEELVELVFGPGGWTRGWSQVECVWKGAAHMDWHSDQTPEETPDAERPNRTVRLTYNIPLVDFAWSNGAMELLPGTHHLPRNFLRDRLIDIEHLYPVRLDLRRGDAVLRDGNTVHRGTPNLTDRPRPMLDQTYKLKRD